MKKLIPLLALLLLSSACASDEQPRLNQTPQDYGAHSSMNSLDYFGAYTPENRLDSLNIAELELKEWGKYSLKTLDGKTVDGTYHWDVTGSVIYVDAPGRELNFFVGENFIKLVSPGPGEGSIFHKR